MNKFIWLRVALFVFSCSWFIAFACSAQALTITSPTQGTVFAPGSSIQVIVDTNATTFATVGVGVRGGGAVGSLETRTSPPYQFTVSLPKDPVGQRQITAFAVDEEGNGVFSDPVTIDIVSDASINSIVTTPSIINFSKIGEQIPLNISGKFSDGTIADITHSTKTAYSVTNTNVASVNEDGIVTAVGPGGTTVSATYDGFSSSIPVQVPLGDATPVFKVVAAPVSAVVNDDSGNYMISLKLTNNGNERLMLVQLSSAVLNNANAIFVQDVSSDFDPGTSQIINLLFPASAGAPGTVAALRVNGSYTGPFQQDGSSGQQGALSFSFRIRLP